ncbi:MAG: 4-alpha-glucanotransferase [Bacillota bacterium]|nr:4-alpha-glucanotransferase [Bacillota bacterium]
MPLWAYQSQDSPYYSWYRFKDFPETYDCWWGIETLPNVNELEPSYQDFIIFQENSVLKYWQRSGVRGWRLDVADELPPAFIKNFRKTMKEIDHESILIGEVWEDASNKISYGERREYLLGEELDAATNYPFRNILLDFILSKKDGQSIHAEMMRLFENYPLYHFYSAMNITGSHDVPRLLTVLSDVLPEEISSEEKTRLQNARIKLASLWQLTFPGIPSIYYGDEAGLEGGQDPQNRGTFPWGRENLDILNWYKEVISLRNHYDVLQTGHWIPLYAQGDIYCYLRRIENNLDVFREIKKNNTAVVLLNRNASKEINLSLDLSRWCQGRLVDPLQNYEEVILDEGMLNITLQPLEGRLLIQDRWGDSLEKKRESGVLLHITSPPSEHGIGGLGKEAYEFADFLERSGQKLWQILPLNPPALGDSPYQCFSAFAGNPLLIDPDGLRDEFVLTGEALEAFSNVRWVDGPGEKFFTSIKKDLGDIPLIAENLGHLTPAVEDLRMTFSFPGMKVMQFIMDGRQCESFKIPLYEKDTVVYTGTHDNDTILGWYNQKNNCECLETDKHAKEICWHFIELAFKSNAQRVIIPLQDILCLGSKARMNIPGTIENNWIWRFQKEDLTNEVEAVLKNLTKKTNR